MQHLARAAAAGGPANPTPIPSHPLTQGHCDCTVPTAPHPDPLTPPNSTPQAPSPTFESRCSTELHFSCSPLPCAPRHTSSTLSSSLLARITCKGRWSNSAQRRRQSLNAKQRPARCSAAGSHYTPREAQQPAGVSLPAHSRWWLRSRRCCSGRRVWTRSPPCCRLAASASGRSGPRQGGAEAW